MVTELNRKIIFNKFLCKRIEPVYKAFDTNLVPRTQRVFNPCYGETVHVRLEPMTDMWLSLQVYEYITGLST